MAQVGTANTHSELEPEKLIEFIDELRSIGFNIGTQQYFAVQDLLILLAAQGQLPTEPEGLETWLAPILCTSAKEQESFHLEFDRWLKQHREPKSRSRRGRHRERAGTPKSRRSKLLTRRTVLAVAISLLVTVGAIVLLKRIQPSPKSDMPGATTAPSLENAVPVSAVDGPTMLTETPTASPAAPRKRWVEIYSTYFKQIRAGAVGIPFLIVGIWWLRKNYRSHSLLEKWSTTRKPRLEHVRVGGVSAGLFRETGFRRIAQELRRHRRSASYDLDVQPTVDATIRAGGRFTPIYSSRRVTPEYLVLIDRVTFRDQQAQLEDKLISRLVEDNVFVDRYYFHRDPRICRREDPATPHLTLRDLAALHPDHYLIVFSDGAGLINPLSGRPQRWLKSFLVWPGRALLTEESIADWGYREWALSSLGFAVFPASKTGLQLLVETINARVSQRTIAGEGSKRYPKLVQERPERWLDPSAPEPAVVDELCRQLRAFLGEEDYDWLAACAVYPVLQWDLTLYFGIKLTRREALEERLLALVRLPWFRHGVMPDWFRERLISDLSDDRERAIRQTLADLLITSLEQPLKGFALEVARQRGRETRACRRALGFIGRMTRNRRLRSLLQAWIETEPEHSPLRDYVFLRFVANQKANKLAVSVPGALPRVFQPKGATLGLRPISALLLAGTVSLVAWIAITRTQPNPDGSPLAGNAGQPVSITKMYMDLIQIPGGKFQMGRNGSFPQESPAHVVGVPAFEMDKNEVTNAEYGEFVRQTNHAAPEQWGSPKSPFGEESLPVSNISYLDAVDFAAWRSKRDGVTYRLPTEEEWEYAARNGDNGDLYPWGNSWEAGRAATSETGVGKQQPGGTYPLGANRWGVQDLMGNVWEWTSSKASQYPGNPVEIVAQLKEWIVIRGGGYNSSSNKVTGTMREFIPPNFKDPQVGFRLVKVSP